MSDFAGEGGGYGGGHSKPQASTFGNSALRQAFSGGAGGAKAGKSPPAPRQVTGFKDELIDRPIQDIKSEVGAFFDLNALLEINPQTDGPEEQAKKQQTFSRWQQLDSEQQQVASQLYQQEMTRRQSLEREERLKAQQKAAKPQLVMPQSPTKGPDAGGGQSRKKAAATQLTQNRQSFNKVQSSG